MLPNALAIDPNSTQLLQLFYHSLLHLPSPLCLLGGTLDQSQFHVRPPHRRSRSIPNGLAGMKWCLPSWCKGSQPEIYSRIIVIFVMYNKQGICEMTNYKSSNSIPIHRWQQVKETTGGTFLLAPWGLDTTLTSWSSTSPGLEGKLLDFDVGLGGQTVYRLIRWVLASCISETNTTASTWLLRPVLVTSSWQFLRHGQF